MKTIKKLTDAQKARLPEWRDKWIGIGLSTCPADFEKAERAALSCYDVARLKRPKVVLRMGSPFASTLGGYLAAVLLKSQVESQVESQVRSQVESQVWSQVGSQVESQVGSQVWSQVWSQVRSQVESQVWAQVGSQVESQVESQVWSQVRSQVESQVESQVGNAWKQYRGCALWAAWGSYVTFFRDVCGWTNKTLTAFVHEEALMQSCGWSWWHDDVVALSDRPRILKRDDEHRLHSVTGPAIRYPDGWSIYCWHGISIPAEWIETPAKLDAKTALTWKNVEQRRAACEIVGWANILKQLEAKTIDRDSDPEIGELVEVTLPEIGRERFLRVRCGTGREFALPVPSGMPTALAANAWTYAIDGNLLKLKEVRT